jgi:hypothetical protein
MTTRRKAVAKAVDRAKRPARPSRKRAPAKSPRNNVLQRLVELSDQIPDNVQAEYPTDGSVNLDRYLRTAIKRA